jgi:hypothetical protein
MYPWWAESVMSLIHGSMVGGVSAAHRAAIGRTLRGRISLALPPEAELGTYMVMSPCLPGSGFGTCPRVLGSPGGRGRLWASVFTVDSICTRGLSTGKLLLSLQGLGQAVPYLLLMDLDHRRGDIRSREKGWPSAAEFPPAEGGPWRLPVAGRSVQTQHPRVKWLTASKNPGSASQMTWDRQP